MEASTPLYSLQKLQSEFPSVKCNDSKTSADFIRQFYLNDIGVFESFFLLTLNNASETTGYFKISQGGITGTVVDIRIVAKYAIENLAAGVILAHNHPSGKLTPSDADIKITERIQEAMALFGVRVLDHIILTEQSFLSFADEGILKQ